MPIVHKFVAKVHGLTVEGPPNLLLGREISRSAYMRMSGAMGGVTGGVIGQGGVRKSSASKSSDWGDVYSLNAMGNKQKGKGEERGKERGQERYKNKSNPVASSSNAVINSNSSSNRGSGRGSGGGSLSTGRETSTKSHRGYDLDTSHPSPSPFPSADSFSTPLRAVSALRSSYSSGDDSTKSPVRRVTFNFDENDIEWAHLSDGDRDGGEGGGGLREGGSEGGGRGGGGGRGRSDGEEGGGVQEVLGDSDCSADEDNVNDENNENNDEDEDESGTSLAETTDITASGTINTSLVSFRGSANNPQHGSVRSGLVGTIDAVGTGSETGSRLGSGSGLGGKGFWGPGDYLQDGHHSSDPDSGGEGVRKDKGVTGRVRTVRVTSKRSSLSSGSEKGTEKRKRAGSGKGEEEGEGKEKGKEEKRKGKRKKKISIRAADALDNKSKSMNIMVLIKALADGTITAPILSGASCPTVRLQNRETIMSKNYTLQLRPTHIDILFNSSKASSAASGLTGTEIGAGGNMLDFKEFLVLLRFLGEKHFNGRSGGGPRANRPGGKISRKALLDRGETKTKSKESDPNFKDHDVSGDSSDGCVRHRVVTSDDPTVRIIRDIPDMRDIRGRGLHLPNTLTPTPSSLPLTLSSAPSPSISSAVPIDVHSLSMTIVTASNSSVTGAVSVGLSALPSPSISNSLWGSKFESRSGSRGVSASGPTGVSAGERRGFSAGGFRNSSSAGERRREREKEKERESESQCTVCRLTEITGDGEDGSLNMVLLAVIKVFLSLTVVAALNKGDQSV